MKDVDTEFIYWKEESELEDLHRIEISLYPIPQMNGPWQKQFKSAYIHGHRYSFVATAFERITGSGKWRTGFSCYNKRRMAGGPHKAY
jgi:hypothetical protein